MVITTQERIVRAMLMAFVAGLLIGFAVAKLTHSDPASAQAAFNHNQCQYPDRTTNPPDGCDNSDPCDPARVKGGSGDCKQIDNQNNAIVNEPAASKTEVTSLPQEPSKVQLTNNCGGK